MYSSLSDPRQYPSDNIGNNRLIYYTNAILKTQSDEDRALWTSSLEAAVEDLLRQEDTLLLSVALSMMPSQQHYKVLWQIVRDVIERASKRYAIIFALPIVLVVGARQKTPLPTCIRDVDKLNALMREHGVLGASTDGGLSGKLLHPDAIVSITPSQLYRYTRQLVDAARGLPLSLEPKAVICHEEGVFLRYLLGVVMQEQGTEPALKLGASAETWGIPLMTFLTEQLKTEGLTLFPIPRSPMPLMQAIVAGQFIRLEVALQVFASTTIRKLRETGNVPVALMSAHEGGELRFTIAVSDDLQPSKGFIWPLSPLDNVELIASNFWCYMVECQVNDIRIAPGIQPRI